MLLQLQVNFQEIKFIFKFKHFYISHYTGWGRHSDSIPGTSPILREVTVPVITNAQCSAVFSGIIDSTLCIATPGGQNVCSGDSGGPLTVERNGQPVQVGIAVFVASAGCEAG